MVLLLTPCSLGVALSADKGDEERWKQNACYDNYKCVLPDPSTLEALSSMWWYCWLCHVHGVALKADWMLKHTNYYNCTWNCKGMHAYGPSRSRCPCHTKPKPSPSARPSNPPPADFAYRRCIINNQGIQCTTTNII